MGMSLCVLRVPFWLELAFREAKRKRPISGLLPSGKPVLIGDGSC